MILVEVERGHVRLRMTGAKLMVQMMRAYGVAHAFHDTEACGLLIRMR
jgi:hypothetical protein